MSDQQQQFGEDMRSLVADYQETFSTPAGQRVLAHLMDYVLLTKMPSVVKSNAGIIFPNSDKAMYCTALSDVAKYISNMLSYDFTKMYQRPVVHHKRPPRTG